MLDFTVRTSNPAALKERSLDCTGMGNKTAFTFHTKKSFGQRFVQEGMQLDSRLQGSVCEQLLEQSWADTACVSALACGPS